MTQKKQALKRYNSIQEFYNDLQSSEKKGCQSDFIDFEFSGTQDIEEANKLLLEGDPQTVDLITSETKTRPRQEARTNIRTSYAGFVPNIPACLSGRPDNMFTIQRQRVATSSSKVVNMVYFVGASWHTDKDKLADAGARLLRVIKTAERNGYRCNLYVGRVSDIEINNNAKKRLLASFAVKIKDSGKPLNISNIAYPLASPSFFRRHAFWWNDCQTFATGSRTVIDKQTLRTAANEIAKNATWIDYFTLSETSDADTYARLIYGE